MKEHRKTLQDDMGAWIRMILSQNIRKAQLGQQTNLQRWQKGEANVALGKINKKFYQSQNHNLTNSNRSYNTAMSSAPVSNNIEDNNITITRNNTNTTKINWRQGDEKCPVAPVLDIP